MEYILRYALERESLLRINLKYFLCFYHIKVIFLTNSTYLSKVNILQSKILHSTENNLAILGKVAVYSINEHTADIVVTSSKRL